MRSSSWHAHGNRYLVVEQEGLTPEAARALVGDADGILQARVEADDRVAVVIWNPDGSTAELSGNGTRIAARWLAQRTGALEVTVAVGGREVRARMLGGDDVEQDMGRVEVGEPETIDVGGDPVEVVPVDVGNPHAVLFRDPAREELLRLGPLVERHPRFPGRTNVQLARVDAPGLVTARVWERGAGETASSGTSAVAVAAAAHAYRSGAAEVSVRFPGGDLRVRLADGRATLTGPAAQER